MLTNEEIDRMVKQRDYYRSIMDYKNADSIKSQLESINVEIKDISYKLIETTNSAWSFKSTIVNEVKTDLMELAHSAYELLASSACTEHELCARVKGALKLQAYSSEKSALEKRPVEGTARDIPVVDRSSEMQGRKYADAAFEFSMAGISDVSLYEQLADCCVSELRRFGSRASCKPLQLLQMAEKLAVAGVRGHEFYRVAEALLIAKSKTGKTAFRARDYSLLSGRPLLWLWRHATKQKKPTKTSATTATAEDDSTAAPQLEYSATHTPGTFQQAAVPMMPSPASLFTDPALPLVLDLGCGYGVSLLGLCHQASTHHASPRCNYLGVDLNNRAIRYASGICRRWQLEGNCAFVYADCIEAIKSVRDNYPGPVALVMVNFPTPYSIGAVLGRPISDVSGCDGDQGEEHTDTDAPTKPVSTAGGNTQLPAGFDYFMFNLELVALVKAVLAQSLHRGVGLPLLLLQSNVEDVVVTMSNIATVNSGSSEGHFAVPALSELSSALVCTGLRHEEASEEAADQTLRWRSKEALLRSTDVTAGGGRMPQRLQVWLKDLTESGDAVGAAGSAAAEEGVLLVGARRRACGEGWLDCSPLPLAARTETEVHCELEKQPVHRTVLVYRSQQTS